MSWGTNVPGGQAGWPTAVIYSSLACGYEAAKALGAAHVYGMEYGIQGLLQGKIVDLDDRLDDKMEIELLKRTPSSYLGSCRFKLPTPATDERPFVQLFELFAKYCIGAVFYIGGNDSMDTIAKLSAYGAAKGSEIRFIGVPKTIDNDLMYTDHTPGYGSAAKYIATILKEASCDSSVYNIRSVTGAEIMGRHTGWLAGAASLAAGADCNGPDIILLPELPYDIKKVAAAVENRAKAGKNFSILAVAEGAFSVEEAKMKRKEWTAKRAAAGYTPATNRIAAAVQKKTGMETRVCIPGHMQRGGSPSANDRVLATEFGSYAAKQVEVERYGVTVAMVNNRVVANRLEDIAGKTRNIPEGCELLTVARRMGVSLG